ncbi:MAG: MarR family transcriptional regulator [Rubrivivax sp.]|nr:MarR family transcriptional regulator [Rubrivivax sp.]
MHTSPAVERAQALRAFNRFYTRRIGVVGERVLGSPFSLAETRVLWEIAHDGAGGRAAHADGTITPRGSGPTASSLARALELDAGYLSRLLASLRRRGLVQAVVDAADRRQRHLRLTAAGRRAFAPLERRSQQQMQALLAPLSDAQQREVLAAAERLGTLLGERGRQAAGPGREPLTPIHLRPPRPGDIGWVVSRHGALYADEYGWDWTFEALVARIAADFVERFDASREACWIAEREGPAGPERAGCVFLVQARHEKTGEVEPGIAQLRMLIVEPAARGHGLGRRLVQECERFARERRYRLIRLWTNSVLLAARAIYEAEGYRLVAREKHRSFGKKLVGETWEKALP